MSGFDTVNLYNGSLNFRLPLLTVGGRGGASHTITLTIEQHWSVNHNPSFGLHTPQYNWWTGIKPGYGPGVLQGRQIHEGCGDGGPVPGGQQQANSLTRLTFTLPDGTEFELRDQQPDGDRLLSTCCCYYNPGTNGESRGRVFRTADGTAATFVSDTTIYDWVGNIDSGPHIIYPTGFLTLRDGTRYRIEEGLVTVIRGRNGSEIHFGYDLGYRRVTSITDSLNRQITIEYDVSEGGQYGVCDRIIFSGSSGAQRIIRISRTNLGSALRNTQTGDVTSPQTYYTLFPELSGSSSSTTYNPSQIVSSAWLPDGRRYRFYYNAYGELARADLPTGGAYEYDWAAETGSGVLAGDEIYRRVIKRRTYSNGTTLEGKATYSRPGAPPAYAKRHTHVDYLTTHPTSGASYDTPAPINPVNPVIHLRNLPRRQIVYAVNPANGSSAWDVEDPQVWQWANGSWNRGALRLFYSTSLNDYSGPNPALADNNGNIRRMDHFVPNALDGSGTITSWVMSVDEYLYDELNWLTRVTETPTGGSGPGFVQQFIYDRWGNRKIDTVATSNHGGGITDLPFNVLTANNRLVAPSDTTGDETSTDLMRYDKAGNLVYDNHSPATGQRGTMAYDAENRMTSAVNGNNQFRYDADGKRTRRTMSGQPEMWLVYGVGGELVAEYDAVMPGGTLKREYGYRGGQMLIVYDGTLTGDEQLKWMVTDHLGSTRMLVNRSGSLSGIQRRDYLSAVRRRFGFQHRASECEWGGVCWRE